MLLVWFIAAQLLSGDSFFIRQPARESFRTFSPVSFRNAIAFSRDPFGRFYILDSETNKLSQLSADGTLLSTVGGYGWSDLAFDNPTDLSTPNGLDVYVADYGNHRIQRLDQNFNFVSVLYFRENENTNERFGYPASVAVSGHGDLFLTDEENSRIIKINKNSQFDKAFGGIDAGQGRLKNPSKIRLSQDGLVYVKDGNSIKIFDAFGNYLRSMGGGVFNDLRSFRLENESLIVLDSCFISMIRSNGEVERTMDISAIFSEDDPGPARDVILSDSLLYILTPKRIYVLELRDELD